MTRGAIDRDKVGAKIVDIWFGLDGNLHSFRTSGFSHAESEFTWSDSEISRILLLDPKLEGKLLLLLEGNPFLFPSEVEEQNIEVFFDGVCVAKFGVTAPFFRAVTIAPTGMSTHTLEFRYPTCRSPSEFGLSDARELGIAWSNIRIYKVEPVSVSLLPTLGNSDAQNDRLPVAVAGNCFSESIAAGLLLDPKIKSRVKIEIVPLHLMSLKDEFSVKTIAEASIVFYQYLAGMDREAVYSLISKHAKIMWYPDIVLRSVWPFDGTHWRQDEIAAQTNSLKIRHQDGALALLRELETDKKKRIKRYKELDFGLKVDVPKIANIQKRFLLDIDKKNDIKIGKYVLNNYQIKPLFYDCTHPSEFLIEELCNVCAEELGVNWAHSDLQDIAGWRAWSLPVHPLIGQQLGLKWSGDSVKYRYGELGDVTWEQWVEAYIDEFG